MARIFETNIAINAVPTAPNHAARLADLDTAGVGPPSFAGTIDEYGDMLFYLSPDGDDANDALSSSTAGRSLPALLARIRTSDHTLPRAVGVHIFLAVGEYDIPPGYITPVFNRPLTISGMGTTEADVMATIVSAREWWHLFNDRITLKYLCSKGSMVQFFGANVTLEYVYFDMRLSYGVIFSASNAFMSGCAFRLREISVLLSDEATLVYLHDSASFPSVSNDSVDFLYSEGSAAFVYNCDDTIRVLESSIDSFSSIRFERSPDFLGELFTGQVVDGKYVYSQVFTGTITAAAGAVASVSLRTATARALNWNGWWSINSTTTVSVSTDRLSANTWSSLEVSSNTLRFYTCHSSARTNMPYRIWVEYTKV